MNHRFQNFKVVPAILAKIWFQIVLVLAVVGLRVSAELIDEKEQGRALALKALQAAFILIGAWAFNRVLTLLRDRNFGAPKLAPGIRAILFLVARIVLFSLAMLVVLDTIGISVTPLIASLGVGSLAVALALQDTLGNLFSGFYINLDRPVSPGDWIELENGTRGQVLTIGWRTTRLQLPDNNTLILPNSKLAASIITNFTLSGNEMSASVALGVAYGTDLEIVERVGVQTAIEVLSKVPGGVVEPPPVVRFSKFGESSIDLSVGFRVKRYGDQYLAIHELVKALHRKFKEEGIEIPYPHRTIQVIGRDGLAH